VNALVDFGRPNYNHVLMFRIPILQAGHALSDERTEYLINAGSCSCASSACRWRTGVPDANSIG
jgi:hypothetical protein